SYQRRNYRVTSDARAAIATPTFAPRRVQAVVRTVEAELPADAIASRTAHQKPFQPPRGFMAPILDRTLDFGSVPLAEPSNDADHQAATLIERELAREGLLPTL